MQIETARRRSGIALKVSHLRFIGIMHVNFPSRVNYSVCSGKKFLPSLYRRHRRRAESAVKMN